MAEGMKDSGGKPQWSLLHGPLRGVLSGIVDVMTHAVATKYKPDSWLNVPGGLMKYRDAQERHWDDIFLDGEDFDRESGLKHAFHYGACALIVSFYMAFRPDHVEAERKRCRGGE